MKKITKRISMVVATVLLAGIGLALLNTSKYEETFGKSAEKIYEEWVNFLGVNYYHPVNSPKPVDDFSVKVPKGTIALLQWDTEFKLDELLGKPLSDQTETLGIGADTFQGSFVKKVKYDGLQIELFSPKDNGKSFYVLELGITKRGYSSAKGIQVGDSTEQLKQVYPGIEMAKDGRTEPDNCQYIIKDVNDFKYITFEVEAGKVKMIRIYYELQ